MSTLITSKLWNFQRVLHTLAATQEVPRHTRLHSRGTTRVPPTSRGAPFAPSSSRGGILSLSGPQRIPGVPVASQEEALSTGKARGTPVSCHIPRVTRCLRPFQGNLFSLYCLDFQSEDQLPPRWHVGHHCGKASWDSLVGKGSWESVVGKPRGKATDPLILAKGSSTLLLQLGGKRTCMPPLETRTDSPGETPEVPQDTCQQWRGILRFWHRLHTRS